MSTSEPDIPTPPSPRLPEGAALPVGRSLVMGILNVTPDSFSDGGRFTALDSALTHAHHMIDQGADIIDIGGESTRPNSTRISAEEEWRRVGEVIRHLAADLNRDPAGAGVALSIDTLHASTARKACEAGVAIVNDVSGGRWDPDMIPTVAAGGAAFVVQHYRALPGSKGEHFDYGTNLVGELILRIGAQCDDAIAGGLDEDQLIIDPGLGFSLTNEQCIEVVNSLDAFTEIGRPVLLGASRKRFLTNYSESHPDVATVEITDLAVRAGVWALRVHEVAANAAVVRGSVNSHKKEGR